MIAFASPTASAVRADREPNATDSLVVVRVEVRLHATLVAFLPPGSLHGAAIVEVDDDADIARLLVGLAIPGDVARVVLVNGRDVDDDVRLRPGDVVDVFPPLAGGSRPRCYTREVRLEASRNPVGLPDFKSGVRL